MDRTTTLALATALLLAALAAFALLRGEEPARAPAVAERPAPEPSRASAPEPRVEAPAPAPQSSGIRVAGTVTNPRGDGLPGVAIAVRGARADASVTDAAGGYTLGLDPRPGEVPTLRFSAAGYQDALVEMDPASLAAGSVQLDVRLEPAPGPVVSGTLRDERGAPIAGETIELTSADQKARHVGVAGSDGTFFIPGVDPGPGYVSVRPRGGYGDFARGVEVGPDGLSLDITLRALSTVRIQGRLVDVTGNPIPGLDLAVVSGQALGRTLATATDADGYFELENVPSGHLTFRASAPEPFDLGGVLVRPDSPPSELLLRADWGEQTLRGRVLDAGGRPLRGAEVELSWSHVGEGSGGRSVRSAVTDAGGSFEFRRLGTGIHQVEVRAAGHRDVRLDYEVTPRSPGLELQLEPANEPG